MFWESVKRVRRRFMSDIWRRLEALGLALLLWLWIFNATTQQQEIRNILVTITCNSSKHQVSKKEIKCDITVQFTGEDKDASWMNPESYEYRLNLPEHLEKSGIHEFHLNDLVKKKQPRGVQLKEIVPATIRVNYDEIKEVMLGLEHVTSKVSENGDVVSFSNPLPARVQVKGPYSVVSKLKSMRVKEPDMNKIQGNKIELQIVNPDSHSLEIKPDKVQFDVHVLTIAERDYERVPYLLLPHNSDLVLADAELQPVTVRLHGPVRVLERLKDSTSGLRLYVDLTDVTEPGLQEGRKVSVGGLPSGVEVVSEIYVHEFQLKKREVPVAKVLDKVVETPVESKAAEAEEKPVQAQGQ